MRHKTKKNQIQTTGPGRGEVSWGELGKPTVEWSPVLSQSPFPQLSPVIPNRSKLQVSHVILEEATEFSKDIKVTPRYSLCSIWGHGGKGRLKTTSATKTTSSAAKRSVITGLQGPRLQQERVLYHSYYSTWKIWDSSSIGRLSEEGKNRAERPYFLFAIEMNSGTHTEHESLTQSIFFFLLVGNFSFLLKISYC